LSKPVEALSCTLSLLPGRRDRHLRPDAPNAVEREPHECDAEGARDIRVASIVFSAAARWRAIDDEALPAQLLDAVREDLIDRSAEG